MQQYDVKCPICGTLNENLFLEETNGWMECEHCHMTTKTPGFEKGKKIPVYTMEQASAFFKNEMKPVSSVV